MRLGIKGQCCGTVSKAEACKADITRWPKCWDPATHMGDPNKFLAPGLSLS